MGYTVKPCLKNPTKPNPQFVTFGVVRESIHYLKTGKKKGNNQTFICFYQIIGEWKFLLIKIVKLIYEEGILELEYHLI
jgi:hypothetical protein